MDGVSTELMLCGYRQVS